MRTKPQRVASKLNDQLPEAIEAAAVPGVSVGIVCGDERSYANFGVTNVAHPLEVTPKTVFEIGSISKLFTVMAALRLVEAGRLDLDEPVLTYYPALRLSDASVRGELTMRHLLSHSGGFAGDFQQEAGRGDDCLEKTLVALAAAPQWTAPGKTMHYSNLGFVLAGYLISKLAAETFESYVQNSIINSLNLGATSYFLSDVSAERIASGHFLDAGATIPCGAIQARNRGPAGGILSNVDALLDFAQAHIQGDDRGLSGRSLDSMREKCFDLGGGKSMGLGWFINQTVDSVFLSHGGGTVGYLSKLIVVPDQKIAFAILANSTSAAPVIELACRIFLREACDWQAPEYKCDKVARLDGLEGKYGAVFGPRIELKGNEQMSATISPGIRDPHGSEVMNRAFGMKAAIHGIAELLENDEIRIIPKGTPVDRAMVCQIIRDDDGEIIGLRGGARLLPRIHDCR